MSITVRIVALWVAVVAAVAPLRLALFVASVEPSSPIQLGFLLPFALAGLALASGYIGLAALPRVFSRAGLLPRFAGAGFLVVTGLATIYLFHSVSSMLAFQPARMGHSLVVCASVAIGLTWLLLATVWPGWLNLHRHEKRRAIEA